MDLKFDEKGLIPAIVQDHYTKEAPPATPVPRAAFSTKYMFPRS